MERWYGLLVGLVYTIPFAFTGFLAGNISERVNRKVFLGAAIILSSITFGVSGLVSSFAVFVLMRGLQAALSSAVSPFAYSIIKDTVPHDYRCSANSMIASCFNLGEGLSSFSILLISMFGWRSMYGSICVVGCLVGLSLMTMLKEPARGNFESSQDSLDESDTLEPVTREQRVREFFISLRQLFRNPTARNCFIAAMFRNGAGVILYAYLPVFFVSNYPNFLKEFSFLNAAALSICGLVASILEGLITDRYQRKTYWTKTIVNIG